MRTQRFTIRLTGLLALALIFTASAASAQISYGEASYKELVDSSSPDTIAPGTKITLDNWQQYRRFMPVGIQALYSGQYGFKIGAGDGFAITVAPTIPIKLSKAMRENTEKYAGQSKLRPLGNGGYTIDNYTAGVPFPAPEGADAGEKVMFNLWYAFYPFLSSYHSHFFISDRYANLTPEESIATTWQLTHLSDPPYPLSMPYASGYYHSTRDLLLIPEQSKYTTALDMQPDDPTKVQETFIFLPSLRRSLRLSSSARCSPILGTDWIQDDNNGGAAFQISKFRAVLLGRKKILAIAHADLRPGIEAVNSAVHVKDSVPGWPLPAMGKWEVRDHYVIDIQPIDSEYCYAHKIFYVDAEDWGGSLFETYDKQGKLWKVNKNSLGLVTLSTGEEVMVPAATEDAIWDLQNTHVSVSTVGSQLGIDKNAPEELQDGAVWAFPSGLARIMR